MHHPAMSHQLARHRIAALQTEAREHRRLAAAPTVADRAGAPRRRLGRLRERLQVTARARA